MKNLLPLSALLLVLTTSGCAQKADLDAQRTKLRSLDARLLKDVREKDLDSFLSVYADDIVVFPPNAPLVTGRKAARTLWAALFSNTGFSLSWQLTDVDVSRAGDMAYEPGFYELTTRDPGGKLVTVRGKFVAIFKNQPDGEWKQVVDIWNLNDGAPAMVGH